MIRLQHRHNFGFGSGQSPPDLLHPGTAAVLLNGDEVDDLDGNRGFGLIVEALVDLAVAALPHLLQHDVLPDLAVHQGEVFALIFLVG